MRGLKVQRIRLTVQMGCKDSRLRHCAHIVLFRNPQESVTDLSITNPSLLQSSFSKNLFPDLNCHISTGIFETH